MLQRFSATSSVVQIETETGEGCKEETQGIKGMEMIVDGHHVANEVMVGTMDQAYAYRMLGGNLRLQLALV